MKHNSSASRKKAGLCLSGAESLVRACFICRLSQKITQKHSQAPNLRHSDSPGCASELELGGWEVPLPRLPRAYLPFKKKKRRRKRGEKKKKPERFLIRQCHMPFVVLNCWARRDHMTFTVATASRLCEALQEEWERVFGAPLGITNE